MIFAKAQAREENARLNVAVVVFPGSNCERDMHYALREVYGLNADLVWHTDKLPDKLDAIVIPGGFTYGDRLRAGAIAAHTPVIDKIRKFAEGGRPVLGVCNGFQILTEANILPGALIRNNTMQFMCRWVDLVVENTTSAITGKLNLGQKISIAAANGEGKYYIDYAGLESLKHNNQIILKYDYDVNGSSAKIAGVSNREGNVVGLMPHPERSIPEVSPQGNEFASMIFESFIERMKVMLR